MEGFYFYNRDVNLPDKEQWLFDYYMFICTAFCLLEAVQEVSVQSFSPSYACLSDYDKYSDALYGGRRNGDREN